MKRILTMLLFTLTTLPIQPQSAPLIINVDNRNTASLNGSWQIIVDPYENGYYNYRYQPNPNGYFRNQKPASKSDLVEYDFDTGPTLQVPGDWNTQRKDLFFYEGTVWYKRDFDYRPKPNIRQFVYFGAVNYRSHAYLNGELLGEHEGGFTPFLYEVTGKLHEEANFLILKVDNTRRREAVPTVNTDWWNYGGITRRVLLVEVPETFIRDYFIQLKPGSADTLAGWVQLDGPAPAQQVTIEIPLAGIRQTVRTDKNGYAGFSFPANLMVWSPEHPELYDVHIRAANDRLIDRIGFRTLETRDSKILLNGRSLFLRGISIHEEAPFRGGRAFSREEARTLLGWAKELGCNFVRLAHYPHNEQMLRMADEMGLLVWAEIPVYWTILWDNPRTFDNASHQLQQMVTRDKNRAAVVIWSVANETPRGQARLAFLNKLIDQTRRQDPTRLISAATELEYAGDTLIVNDPLGQYLDVIGANEYYGWYGGKPEEIPRLRWKSEYDKPLVISEFGGGALYGFHGDSQTRWSEEYQENLYQHQIAMLRKVPFLRGISPWILMDFRSPRRPLPKIQDYWNRKGLISNRGEKKKAFYMLQAFYRQLQNE
ncbi:MAG: beta-glucuronidase [Calditrichaeota bacterium]|nr:beta-glucuronidase [Calditrichota bacterium]